MDAALAVGTCATNAHGIESPAPTPVATPCRTPQAVAETPEETIPKPSPSELGMPPGDVDGDVPYINDSSAKRPEAGQLRLSPTAVNQRMARVFQPSSRTGNFKVSNEILAMYRSKSGKQKLYQVFQSCGFDPDPGLGNHESNLLFEIWF